MAMITFATGSHATGPIPVGPSGLWAHATSVRYASPFYLAAPRS